MLRDRGHQTSRLLRLILRRDRVRIAIWLVGITLLTVVVASAYTELASTEQERQVMAETMRNPAMTAMLGPGYGLDDYTIGAMMGHQMLLFTALAVAIMCIFLVARHTRGDEEYGRIEMLRSLPVGRLSNLSATGLVLLGSCLLIMLMVGISLSALGIESLDWSGSLLYGAALAATGLFFGAVTALFAQLAETTRGTVGWSVALLLLAYLIRAIGDVGNEVIAWLSPLGWIVRSQVYVNNYWNPVFLTALAASMVFAFALYLHSIRDLEAGFIPARPGRRSASRFLQTPLGLAVRLQRTALIAWAVGLFVLGASYGSVLGDLEVYLETMDLIQLMLPAVEGFSLTEQFLPMLFSVISIVSTIPVLLMLLKLNAEENLNRTEPLLARSVSRNRLMSSYFGIALVVSMVVQLLAVLGMWSAGVAVMEDPMAFETIFNAGIVYLPAIWVMMGIAVLLIGFVPRWAGGIWLYLGYSFLVVYIGELLQIPQWMANLSPFGHIPKIPIEDFSWPIFLVLTLLAVGFVVAGFMGYGRRDIQG